MSSSPYETARQLLLTNHGLDEAALNATFARLVRPDIDYADLYFQYIRTESWALEEGVVKRGSFNIEEGVGVRAVCGEKTAFAYSDDIHLDALSRAADAVYAIGDKTGQVKISPASAPVKSHTLYSALDPCASLDTQAKIALLESIERTARSLDPRIVQVMASLSSEYDVIYLARHDGIRAADIRPLVQLSIVVIAEQNGRREHASSGERGRFDLHHFDATRLEYYAREAVEQALINLEARPAPAGQMTVVLGPGEPGVLLHEAVGHGLEGDFNRKGTSAFSGRMGQQVAALGVTVVDDGTLIQRSGSLSIDDEGHSTQCTTLIEKGILTGYMHDALSARMMKSAPTGNARRESYSSIPMPRMRNTYMLAGQHDPAEIISSVKEGLYAARFGGGQVDITNGKFVFSVTGGWRIENGQLSYPVKGATLIGHGPEVLHYVSMIGNDLKLDSGIGDCGKEGQSVPVGTGQPTLRIDGGLTVGGQV